MNLEKCEIDTFESLFHCSNFFRRSILALTVFIISSNVMVPRDNAIARASKDARSVRNIFLTFSLSDMIWFCADSSSTKEKNADTC